MSGDIDEFYLQDSRTYVGNDMLFWGTTGNGYVTDLRLARIYTRGEAMAQHQCRETDIPWPKSYIDARTRPAVDMQYCKRDEALAGSGIELAKVKSMRRRQERCQGCGRFLSDVQRYCEPCPKCGADNKP